MAGQDMQQQAAVTSGQITSMQQHGAGGAANGQNASSVFEVIFGKGLGQVQSFSLSNVGLGKLFTSGELTGGLQTIGGKTAGKLAEGLEMNFDMGQPADGQNPDQQHQNAVMQQQQEAAMQQQAGHHPEMDPNNPHAMQQQMPHGYGHEGQQMPHGYGPEGQQQAMGMGGPGQDGYGQQQAPHGFDGNDDKGMFGEYQAQQGPYAMDAFAAANDARSSFEQATQMRYSNQGYKADDLISDGGNSGGNASSSSGASSSSSSSSNSSSSAGGDSNNSGDSDQRSNQGGFMEQNSNSGPGPWSGLGLDGASAEVNEASGIGAPEASRSEDVRRGRGGGRGA